MIKAIGLLLAGALLGALLAFAGSVTAHDPSDCPGDDDWGLPLYVEIERPGPNGEGGFIQAHGIDLKARVRYLEVRDNTIYTIITFNPEWAFVHDYGTFR